MGVRDQRYKLMYLYGDPLNMTGSEKEAIEPSWEFHDLLRDPYEDYNAYNDEEYQDVIAQLKQEMQKLREQTGDTDGVFNISK